MPEGLEISDGGFDEQVAVQPSSSSSKKKVIIGATILAIVAAVAIAIGIVVGGSSSNKSNEETVSISAMKNGHVFSAYEDHVDLPFETRSHDSSHSYSRSQKPVSVTVVVFPLVMSGISIIGLLLMSYVLLRFSRDYMNSHAYALQKNLIHTPCW